MATNSIEKDPTFTDSYPFASRGASDRDDTLTTLIVILVILIVILFVIVSLNCCLFFRYNGKSLMHWFHRHCGNCGCCCNIPSTPSDADVIEIRVEKKNEQSNDEGARKIATFLHTSAHVRAPPAHVRAPRAHVRAPPAHVRAPPAHLRAHDPDKHSWVKTPLKLEEGDAEKSSSKVTSSEEDERQFSENEIQPKNETSRSNGGKLRREIWIQAKRAEKENALRGYQTSMVQEEEEAEEKEKENLRHRSYQQRNKRYLQQRSSTACSERSCKVASVESNFSAASATTAAASIVASVAAESFSLFRRSISLNETDYRRTKKQNGLSGETEGLLAATKDKRRISEGYCVGDI